MNISWGQVAVMVIGIVLAQFVLDWFQNRQGQLTQNQTIPLTQETAPPPPSVKSAAQFVDRNYSNAGCVE